MSIRFPAFMSAIPLIALLAGAQPARAAGDKAVTVKASVNEICKFSSDPVSLDFGQLDPAADTTAPPVSRKAALSYNCTKGSVPTALGITGISATSITSKLKKNGTSTAAGQSFDYTLSWTSTPTAGLGFSAGKAVSIDLEGSVAATAFQDVEAGAYSDSITFTIAP